MRVKYKSPRLTTHHAPAPQNPTHPSILFQRNWCRKETKPSTEQIRTITNYNASVSHQYKDCTRMILSFKFPLYFVYPEVNRSLTSSPRNNSRINTILIYTFPGTRGQRTVHLRVNRLHPHSSQLQNPKKIQTENEPSHFQPSHPLIPT